MQARERGRGGGAQLGMALLLALAAPAATQQGMVAGTVHNLSVSGPGEIKAMNETEICKFCHVPHSAIPSQPLWGHALPVAPQYQVPEVGRGRGRREAAPQPDGSSRLCLSCHDGTVALGDVVGESRPIRMRGSQRLTAGRGGYLGTDLSGSHPVSVTMPESDQAVSGAETDMRLRPRSLVAGVQDIHLDANGKVQCTTCHDPHRDQFYQQDKVPRFWVRPTVNEVCLTCHELR